MTNDERQRHWERFSDFVPQLTIPDQLRNWNHDIWGLVTWTSFAILTMFWLISKFYQLNMFAQREKRWQIFCGGASWKHVCWINRGITKHGTRVSRSPLSGDIGDKKPPTLTDCTKNIRVRFCQFQLFLTFCHHCFYPYDISHSYTNMH